MPRACEEGDYQLQLIVIVVMLEVDKRMDVESNFRLEWKPYFRLARAT